jgi:undecaprenyl-diphosphatase
VDLLLLIKAVVMGLVEGLTEFLPVSSTGHLILAGEILQFLDQDRRAVFEIMIQLGAILAVCWVYRERLLSVVRAWRSTSSQKFALNLVLAFLPSAILGAFFIQWIKEHFFNPLSVACALVVGGVVILWVERRYVQSERVSSLDEMTWRDALKVGAAQVLSLIPGTSRSGATIIGGLFFGLSRQTATEFSFFLAIPTMLMATLYEGYENRALLHWGDVDVFLMGFFSAFVFALIAVRGLLRYIQRHNFVWFAWYRIVFGLLILISSHLGWVHWGG